MRSRYLGYCGFLFLLLSVVGLRPSPIVQAEVTAVPTTARVLEIVNEQRWQNGQLPPLKGEVHLETAANTHSKNMAVHNFFDHCDLDSEKSPWDRIDDAGYVEWNNLGENIAAGYNTPESVMEGWMDSSGHKENILSPDFWEMGIGYIYQATDQKNVREDNDGDCQADSTQNGPYDHYWTQNFGRRSNIMPVVINREAYETSNRNVTLYMYGTDWAKSMRFRNETGNWSPWRTYNEEIIWQLTAGNGIKIVYAEISDEPDGIGEVRQANDTIVLNAPATRHVAD
ncbi:MAG: CAP domain-containing protein [Chloroflexi bacterium]|nr:CAP domain-containing protein [Chloroflexota bacterium]